MHQSKLSVWFLSDGCAVKIGIIMDQKPPMDFTTSGHILFTAEANAAEDNDLINLLLSIFNLYLPPCIVTFGLIGNMLSFMIFRQVSIRILYPPSSRGTVDITLMSSYRKKKKTLPLQGFDTLSPLFHMARVKHQYPFT